MKIGNFDLEKEGVYIIAELSANHNGNLQNALDTIRAAKEIGANAIKLKEHLTFIESLKSRKDKLYFLLKKEDEFIGVIDFTQLAEKISVHMGIYSNPNIKGNGKILLNKIIDYSFNDLKVKKIFSEVFAENNKAHNLYKKFNFKDISEKIVNNKKVICMELENENR